MSVKVLLKGSYTVSGFQLKSALTELLSISTVTKGINALLKAFGKNRMTAKLIAERRNTTLNQIRHSLFRIIEVRHKRIKGLSQRIFRFHFVCW